MRPLWIVLAARDAGGSTPGRRDDPFRVALVIEGGGSRGAFCGGMALAIEQRGLLPCFDDVYASSSGGLTAAWMLSGQAAAGAELWRDRLLLSRAISPLRLLSGRPVFDTHYLVDEAPQRNGGIDYRAILDNPVRFHPLATDAVTGSVVDMHPFLTSRAAVRDALRATMGLPLVTGRAVCLGGRRLFDGGLAEAIPFHTPSKQGATHILLLRTRRSDQLTTKASWGERLFVASYLAVRGRGALRPWATRYRRGLADEQELTGLCDMDADDISVAQIRPPSTAPTVPRTSRDPVLLAEAIQIGLDAAHKEFERVSKVAAKLEKTSH